MFLRKHYTTVSCSVIFLSMWTLIRIKVHLVSLQPVPCEDGNFTRHGWLRVLSQNDIDDLLGVCVDENDIRKVTFRAKFEELQWSLFFADAMIGIIPDFGTSFFVNLLWGLSILCSLHYNHHIEGFLGKEHPFLSFRRFFGLKFATKPSTCSA